MAAQNHTVYGLAYGKLYLAGEYAILEDKSVAIITSVPKKIVAFIENDSKTTIFDNMHNTEISMDCKHKNFTNIQKLIAFIRDYTGIHKHFKLTIYNELIAEDKKYGLGSSGAVLVAITKAILNYYNILYDNMKIFKLIVTFNLLNNISGSMGDIAAATYDGITFYKKFSHTKVKDYLNHYSIKDMIDRIDWPDLVIEQFQAKAPVEMIAKWTGQVIDTKIHVKKWNETKKEMNLETYNIRKKIKLMLEKRKYKKFVDRSNQLVLRLKAFLKQEKSELIIPIIKDIRKNLLYLEQISNIPMETIAMKQFIMNYPCGKQSGSGCGDMVLAFKTASVDKFTISLDLNKL